MDFAPAQYDDLDAGPGAPFDHPDDGASAYVCAFHARSIAPTPLRGRDAHAFTPQLHDGLPLIRRDALGIEPGDVRP